MATAIEDDGNDKEYVMDLDAKINKDVMNRFGRLFHCHLSTGADVCGHVLSLVHWWWTLQ
jgi:hypothetical protein